MVAQALQAWLCWLVPLAGATPAFAVAKAKRSLTGWYAVAVNAVSAVLASSLIPMVVGRSPTTLRTLWIPTLGLELSVLLDPLSVFMANVAAWIGLLVMVYSVGYMAEEEGQGRYYFFMLLFVGGMTGLVMAGNLLQLYVFWEVVGLCSYALIGFWYHKPSAARAGMKAFITTRVGDVFLLAAILMIYAHTGTFDIQAVKAYVDGGGALPILTISIFILLGAMGKSAQFPLHVWLPDAMEGPTPVSALIHAATMVKAGVYLIARTHTLFCGLQPWLTAVAYVGAFTSLMAAAAALTQTDIKRVLAYSTISQLGMMMASLGVGTELAWFASQFHLLSHALFKALLFLCAGIVMHATGTTDIRRMGGLRRELPTTFAASLVGVLSLSGIPPFNGFWSKELIFESMMEAGNYALLALMVCTSLLTVAYSLRWLYLIFLGGGEAHAEMQTHKPPATMLLPTLILAALSTASGFLEVPLAQFMAINAHLSLNPHLPSTLCTTLVLGVGLLSFAAAYPTNLVPPARLRTGYIGRQVHSLLQNALYVDAVYNKVFVEGLLKALWSVLEEIEVGTIDQFNYTVAEALVAASKYARRIQTGILSYNMILVLLGLLVILLLLLVA